MPPPSAHTVERGTDRRVHWALLFVQLSFGAYHVIGRFVLEHLTPLGLAGIRLVCATPVFLWLAWRHDRILPTRRDLPILALLGFLGVFANQLLFLNGLARTTATNASILMPSIPAFAAVIALLVGIEALRARRVAGILVTMAGALVLVDPSRFTAGDATVLGDLLVLGNCLCYAAFLVLQRPVLQRLPWRTVIAWAFVFGSLGMVPLSLRELAATGVAPLPTAIVAGIVYIVIFPTLLAYSLNSWAIRRSSPSLVAAYTTLQPLFAGLLAVVFLGETTSWRQAAGFAAIAAGLWLVSSAASTSTGSPGTPVRRSLSAPPP